MMMKYSLEVFFLNCFFQMYRSSFSSSLTLLSSFFFFWVKYLNLFLRVWERYANDLINGSNLILTNTKSTLFPKYKFHMLRLSPMYYIIYDLCICYMPLQVSHGSPFRILSFVATHESSNCWPYTFIYISLLFLIEDTLSIS